LPLHLKKEPKNEETCHEKGQAERNVNMPLHGTQQSSIQRDEKSHKNSGQKIGKRKLFKSELIQEKRKFNWLYDSSRRSDEEKVNE